MATSKKDYVALANVIKTSMTTVVQNPDIKIGIDVTCSHIARAMAYHFQATSHSFDKARFLAACGVQ